MRSAIPLLQPSPSGDLIPGKSKLLHPASQVRYSEPYSGDRQTRHLQNSFIRSASFYQAGSSSTSFYISSIRALRKRFGRYYLSKIFATAAPVIFLIKPTQFVSAKIRVPAKKPELIWR